MAQLHTAECYSCGWQRLFDNENEAVVCQVLHAVIRHPEEYHRDTGRDPKQAEIEYKDYINAYRSKL